MNSPYIQAAMAQAMQAIMSGGSLPNNCYVMSIPIEQAQQMFSPWYTAGSVSPMIYAPAPSYYPPSYSPMIAPYQMDYQQPHSNALVPHNSPYNAPFYPQTYNNQNNNNYPMIDYNKTKSKKKSRHRRQTSHPNVYNSSSFDTEMENLSWSRLFGHHHIRRDSQDVTQETPQKKSSNRRQNRSSSTSSTTTSDETIRRVNVSTQQAAAAATTTTSVQTSKQQPQQTKGLLPFKYSSEFVPGFGKQSSAKKTSSRKETKVRSDDVFVVQHPQYPSGH